MPRMISANVVRPRALVSIGWMSIALTSLLAILSGCQTAVFDRAHDDMDRPLSKVQASFPSPEKELRQANASEAARGDPRELAPRSINSPFRAFAAADPIRVHALDVGAGSCILVECPGSTDVLMYDCGSLKRTDFDMTRDDVRAYVDSVMSDTEPIVAMSHAHSDHVNMVPFVMGDRVARSIWIGGLVSDYGGDNEFQVDMHAWLAAQQQGGTVLHHDFDEGFDNGGEPVAEMQCGDAETFVLTVNNRPPSGANDNRRMHANSLILLIRYGDFSAIMTGDAVEEAEAAAIGSYGALITNTTLLFASHHGARSNGSNSEGWIQSTKPAIVVYSADTMPSYGHPKGEVIDRYREAASLRQTKPHRIWRDPTSENSEKEITELAEYVTELNGTIIVESDGSDRLDVRCTRAPDCW